MHIQFNDCLVASVRKGISEKSGKFWSVIKFFDESGAEWSVFCADENAALSIAPRTVHDFLLTLTPDSNGNPRMSVEEVS